MQPGNQRLPRAPGPISWAAPFQIFDDRPPEHITFFDTICPKECAHDPNPLKIKFVLRSFLPCFARETRNTRFTRSTDACKDPLSRTPGLLSVGPGRRESRGHFFPLAWQESKSTGHVVPGDEAYALATRTCQARSLRSCRLPSTSEKLPTRG